MEFFTKQELSAVLGILFVISLVSLFNFRVSLRRARDAQRKADLGSLTGALDAYNHDFRSYPVSSPDGKMLACRGPNTKLDPKTKVWTGFVACEWGKDVLADISDANFPPYLKTFPIDPKKSEGFSYRYVANGRRYQIFAALESQSEDGYDPQIVSRNLSCGNRVCNFGKASGDTPLDKSLEEYENELMRMKK